MSQIETNQNMAKIAETLSARPELVAALMDLLSLVGESSGGKSSGSATQTGKTFSAVAEEKVFKSVSKKDVGASDGVKEVDEKLDWADECSAASSEDSVPSVVGLAPVSEAVRKTVAFGGVGSGYVIPPVTINSVLAGDSEGFMKQYVRTGNVKAFRTYLGDVHGIKVPKSKMIQFALCTYSAATIPAAFQSGKMVHKQLETLGDIAISQHLVLSAIEKGNSVDSIQAVRNKMGSNPYLSRIAVNSGLMQYIVVASGIDVATAKTSADALEVVTGFISLNLGSAEVKKFLTSMQL